MVGPWYKRLNWKWFVAYILCYAALLFTFDPDGFWQVFVAVFVSLTLADRWGPSIFPQTFEKERLVY